MNAVLIRRLFRSFVLTALAVANTACVVMYEPLATDTLKRQIQDPQASVVIIHFQSPPIDASLRTNKFNTPLDPKCRPRWSFSAANESTGWNFQELNYQSMIFRTRKNTFEADKDSMDSGWVTFIVPPGTTYLAVFTPSQFAKVASSYGPCLSLLDFVDAQRFILNVPDRNSFIYAGTIVDIEKCSKSDDTTTCSSSLSISDESDSARSFVARYKERFRLNRSLETQLISVPQNRTIEIP